jgi:hypothetical protein
MKKVLMLLLGCLWTITTMQAQIGKVGINTTTPAAMLHVKDSSVLFSGLIQIPMVPANPPSSGQGVRMMWYPDKAAFRAGYVDGGQWNKDSIGVFSFAAGKNAKALGHSAVSIGEKAQALGNWSVSLGYSNIASGQQSVAIGSNITSSNVGSISLGHANTASGDNAIAIGNLMLSSGSSSIALGHGGTASGPFAVSLGFENTANAQASFATGHNSIASGYASTAFGSSQADGDWSFSMGKAYSSGKFSLGLGNLTIAKSYACVALGQFNDSTSISSFTWNPDDPVFIIGNGSANVARSNAITVLKNAKTGINIENPLAGLHIKGIEATYDAHIRLETATIGSTDYASILYDGNMKYRTFTAGDEYQWRNSANNTTMTLQDDGDLFIDGILTPNSDLRLKKQLQPITDGLDKVLQLQGYHYHWIDPGRDPSLQTGVIAQDIEMILPELVKTDEEGMKGVNYIGIIPYLIEALKEQQITISAQQAKLNSLEKEMQELKSLVLKLAASN